MSNNKNKQKEAYLKSIAEDKKLLSVEKEVPRKIYEEDVQEVDSIPVAEEDNEATKNLITVISATSKGYELSDDVAKREIERRIKSKLEIAETSKAATGADVVKAAAFFENIKKNA
jgi:hypothetical protein